LGINGEPVTIKANELDIIEFGFESGLMVPQLPAVRSGKTIAVVGSGPSGLAAAYYLNKRGHLITVFERAAEPGGLLLNGIPDDKLQKDIVRRRTSLLEREGITFRTGMDVGNGIDSEKLAAEYDCVIRCCGQEDKKKPSLVVYAIAEGKQKAAEADRALMGYTNIK
jgi:glutamate synthase (NADPH/NADH) small chain